MATAMSTKKRAMVISGRCPSHAKGLDPGAVEGMSHRAFNRKLDALTAGEASDLIGELSTMRRVVA
jgi:hypothetical protein